MCINQPSTWSAQRSIHLQHTHTKSHPRSARYLCRRRPEVDAECTQTKHEEPCSVMAFDTFTTRSALPNQVKHAALLAVDDDWRLPNSLVILRTTRLAYFLKMALSSIKKNACLYSDIQYYICSPKFLRSIGGRRGALATMAPNEAHEQAEHSEIQNSYLEQFVEKICAKTKLKLRRPP